MQFKGITWAAVIGFGLAGAAGPCLAMTIVYSPGQDVSTPVNTSITVDITASSTAASDQ
jgi:hypothetical protein